MTSDGSSFFSYLQSLAAVLAHYQPPRFPSTASVLQLRYTSLRMTGKETGSGVLEHFLDRRFTVVNAAHAVLAQGRHAELDRLLFQDDRWGALIDQFPDR